MKSLWKASGLAMVVCVAAAIGVGQAKENPKATTEKVETGRAAFYSHKLDGHTTACGGVYKPEELTTAHRKLPCGTKVRITNKKNGKTVEATVSDRGPTSHKRLVDVSRAVAQELDFIKAGTTIVEVEVIE